MEHEGQGANVFGPTSLVWIVFPDGTWIKSQEFILLNNQRSFGSYDS
jgi:hypothetical protein